MNRPRCAHPPQERAVATAPGVGIPKGRAAATGALQLPGLRQLLALSFLTFSFLTLSLLACAPGAERPRNVLLITLDTLRADHLGAYGYAAAETPHLDALAHRGMLFTSASTVMPLTLPAHASLMTGTFPAWHGVTDNGGFYLGEEHQTLAEVLREKGWRTGGFVGAFVLDSRWGIAQGFDRFFDDFDLTRFDDAPGMDAIQRPGAEVVDRALAWLSDDRQRPFFAWVHLYDPHTPYEAPEPFRSRFPASATGAYDAEIASADAQVGRLLSALEADGRLAQTLVVVVGDHGEMLGEHEELTHGFFIYEGALHIPLFLAGPGVPQRVIGETVRIVDVLPTILHLLGRAPPAAVQGVDLSPLARGETLGLLALAESQYPRHHFGWSELSSLRDGSWKLIRAPRRELYDLSADPGETRDLAASDPRTADSLERKLNRLLKEVTGEGPAAPRALDEETARRLQALGYLGSPSTSRSGDDGPRGDPKDKISLYNLLKEATGAAAAGHLEVALERVRTALGEDPTIVEGHMLVGNFERQARRFEAAVAAYQEALRLDPEHQEALYSLSVAYKEMGRLDDALAGFDRAAHLDPRNGKVIWQLADTYMRQRRFAAAEEKLLSALDLDLDRPRFLLKLGECYLEMGRPGDAAGRLREALAASPEIHGAHFHLGVVAEEQGRPQEAAAAYRQELAVNPEGFRAAFNLGRLVLDAGDPREAAIQLRRAVEMRPDFGTGYLYLAKALLDLGDLSAAEEAARRGLKHDPEPRLAPLGHFVLADIYNRRGRPREAAREESLARRLAAEAGRTPAPGR